MHVLCLCVATCEANLTVQLQLLSAAAHDPQHCSSHGTDLEPIQNRLKHPTAPCSSAPFMHTGDCLSFGAYQHAFSADIARCGRLCLWRQDVLRPLLRPCSLIPPRQGQLRNARGTVRTPYDDHGDGHMMKMLILMMIMVLPAAADCHGFDCGAAGSTSVGVLQAQREHAAWPRGAYHFYEVCKN